MKTELIVIIGAYGSGKSEFAIHSARSLNITGHSVVLADLDVVNPYFRSRDVREEFARHGIDVIAPEGEFKHADLPIISPRIKGAIENPAKTVILDVGGDPAGCRTLGRFVDQIEQRGYRMLFVINTRRPFTASVDEIIQMKETLENTRTLRITELVCNTNLMEYTDEAIVRDGIRIVEQVSAQTGLPFRNYLALESFESAVPDGIEGKERLLMTYTLRKPWERLMLKGI